MPQYKVIAVDRSSRSDRELTIEAINADNARIKAELEDLIVSSISEVTAAAPDRDEASPKRSNEGAIPIGSPRGPLPTYFKAIYWIMVCGCARRSLIAAFSLLMIMIHLGASGYNGSSFDKQAVAAATLNCIVNGGFAVWLFRSIKMLRQRKKRFLTAYPLYVAVEVLWSFFGIFLIGILAPNLFDNVEKRTEMSMATFLCMDIAGSVFLAALVIPYLSRSRLARSIFWMP
jgi:hypothetical protein